MKDKTLRDEILRSLDAWHSDKLRENKVYFADAVVLALEEAIKKSRQSAIADILKFIEDERDKRNIEQGGFSAAICLSDLMKKLQKEVK